MGEAKFTPGPWHPGRSDMLSYDASGTIPFKNIYADDPRGGTHKPTNRALPLTVAKAVDESALYEESGAQPISVDELLANAALIGAAPEIYEALAGMVAIEEIVERLHKDRGHPYAHVWLDRARAALAKACPTPATTAEDQS